MRRATRFVVKFQADVLISIHALREEGDPFSGPVMLLPYQFLSTPSVRRATARSLAV